MRITIFLSIILILLLPGESFGGAIIQSALREEARKYRKQGYELQLKGNITGALTYYQKAAKMDPNYPEVYNDLGVIYESLGRDTEAERMYKRALEIDSTYLPSYTNLALFYEKKGRIKDAFYYWKKRYLLGRKGEYWRRKAKEALLRLDKYTDIRKERLMNQAVELSRKLVTERERKRRKQIEGAQLHLELAKKLIDKGDFTSALKELEKARSFNPPDKDLQMKIADVYVGVKKAYFREQLKYYTDQALQSVDNEDYTAAAQDLKKALSMVSNFSRK